MSASRTFYADGQLVEADDLDNDGYVVGTLVGEAVAAFVTDTEVLPASNALTVTPGSGLNIDIGGPNQTLFVRDSNGSLQLADYIPATVLPIAANTSGQTRIDMISGTYFEVANGTFPRDYLSPEGVETPDGITAHYVGRSATFVVTEGTPGQPAPAAPAGTYPIAHIQILNGASSFSQANINVVVPTIGQALQASGATVNPEFVSQDGYLQFAENSTEVAIGLVKPYPTFYSSSDGSIITALLNDTPPTEPVLPNNPITLDMKVNLAALSQSSQIGASNSIAFNAGIAFYRRRANTGTSQATSLPGAPLYPVGSGRVGPGDATSFAPIGSFLGNMVLQTVSGGKNTVQAEYIIQVTPGAGPVTVGGSVDSSTGFSGGGGGVHVFFDNNPAPISSGTGTITWSATIPDDGNKHVLIFLVNDNAQITTVWTGWLPVSPSGGIDHTLIAFVGPSS